MEKKRITCLLMAFIMCLSLFTGVMGNNTGKAYAEENGLVLHLTFDGDLKDSSGLDNNAECTYGQVSYEAGVFGQSVFFNGKSYIEIPDNDSLDLDNFTISLWAYKTKNYKSDAEVPYVYKQEDEESWAAPYKLYEKQENIPTIWLHDASGTSELDQFQFDGAPIDLRQWFMLTITYNGSEVRMYEDGVMTKKVSASGTPAITTGSLYIGMLDGEFYFNGYMDDLRIYDRGFSAGEVTGLYDLGLKQSPKLLTQTNGLVAQYKFDGNYKDSSEFGNDAELVTGKVSFIDGLNGKAAKLSKSTYLEIPDDVSLDFDEGFTVTSWVNIYENETLMALFNRNRVSTSDVSDDLAYSFYVTDHSYDFYYAPFGVQLSPDYTGYGIDKSLKNKWVHIAVTFDTEEVRWYMNGKMVQKEDIEDYAGLKMAHSTGNLTIGTDGEYFFNGAIDELKLYNYALSAKEVETDYKHIDSLSISKDNQNSIKALKVKSSVSLVVNRYYIDTDKSVKPTSGVTYKSSNSKIFTVSKTGVIKAVGKGTAKLTISHGPISKTYTVTVK